MGRAQWEYSMRQAAELCGVSIDTIKRRLRAGDLPHARHLDDPSNTWVVPLGDLVTAGFTITPSGSLQARSPLDSPATNQGGKPIDVRLAVAEALQAAHAAYARTLADLASQAIAALGAIREDLTARATASLLESQLNEAGEPSRVTLPDPRLPH